MIESGVVFMSDLNQAKNNIESRENYLNSFNFIAFADDNTIVIDKKYSIKKSGGKLTPRYSLSNMNDYWKTDISFNLTFDHADLERISESKEYGARYLEFSLWSEDRLLGSLQLKIGYENFMHETSEKLAEFFGCEDSFQTIKVLNVSEMN